jgi:predicted Zn-dependent protease
MPTTSTPDKSEKKVSPADNKKDIENHKKIATHLEEAAKQHKEAAKQHQAGEHDKAAKSTVIAQGHQTLAQEAHKDDAKYHALKS